MTKAQKAFISAVKKSAVSSVKQSAPLRNQQNVKRQKANRKYNKMSMGVAERKLSALTDINEGTPSAIALGALAYKYSFVLGSTSPSTWSGYTPQGGFAFVQGTGNNQRDGRYMYLDKTTMNMSVHMNAQERLTAPTQFRMIIFRARRATTPTGVSYDPNLRLFLKPNGDGFGPGTAGTNFNDLYLQPTNKRDWIIVADKRFCLSPFLADGQTNTAAWQGQYPNFKNFRISLAHKKKSSFQGQTNEPDDYDYHYGVVILAGSVARDTVASGWEVNLRGTTTAIDS